MQHIIAFSSLFFLIGLLHTHMHCIWYTRHSSVFHSHTCTIFDTQYTVTSFTHTCTVAGTLAQTKLAFSHCRIAGMVCFDFQNIKLMYYILVHRNSPKKFLILGSGPINDMSCSFLIAMQSKLQQCRKKFHPLVSITCSTSAEWPYLFPVTWNCGGCTREALVSCPDPTQLMRAGWGLGTRLEKPSG